MATSTSSDLAARRRKLTYGKPSRSDAVFSWGREDATSPERPHKPAAGLKSTLKKPTLAKVDAPATAHKSLSKLDAGRDLFDVPLEDEVAVPPTPTPVKKITTKPIAPVDEWDVPSSDDGAIPSGSSIKKPLQPSRKAGLSRPAAKPLNTIKKTEGIPSTSSENDPAAPPVQSKAPQPQKKGRQPAQAQAVKEVVKSVKTSSCATPPAVTVPKTQKKLKLISEPPLEKDSTKTTAVSDVFDFPPSDDEARLLSARKPTTKPLKSAQALNPIKVAQTADSDDSSGIKKRKRAEPSQSSSTNPVSKNPSKSRDALVPAPSNKHQKHGNIISPRQGAANSSGPGKALITNSENFTIREPPRARARATPGPGKPGLAKGLSSPAKLHGMLALRSQPKNLPRVEARQVPTLKDETMYDIPERTPVAQLKSPKPQGSVTPRQKHAFGSLLDHSSELLTPDLPSIRRLQLTDTKTTQHSPSLGRSSSDIPQTSHSRKSRLVDTLRRNMTDSEGDSAESESESDEQTEEDIIDIPNKSVKNESSGSRDNVDKTEEMDIEDVAPAHSQPSQHSISMALGARVTYANQRTYRQEENPEDDLFQSMDLDDDNFGLGGSKKPEDSVSEGGEEPDSLVRGIHELRRQGQNQKFLMNTQHDIDEIADKAGLGPSFRRSAMLDFCTKLADNDFRSALLESAFSHEFLRSITSTGEIIFDFAASVAAALLFKTESAALALDDVQKSGILATLPRLLDRDMDISRISKERKTNLSPIAREAVSNFRGVVQNSLLWTSERPDVVSPQIVSLASLEIIVLQLRKAGYTETLVTENTVAKLLDLSQAACERLQKGTGNIQELLILDHTFSIMEALSVSDSRHSTWSNAMLQRLATVVPALLKLEKASSPIMLAIRLCVQLSNNRPKVCAVFEGPGFVQPLTQFIVRNFAQMGSQQVEEKLEKSQCLILALGAMINLAELSDHARVSAIAEGDDLIDALVKAFLAGSERAARADSLEESQANVPIGYLTVLLGNLCLNDLVRDKVQPRLPAQKMDFLVTEIKKFVRLHQRVDQEVHRIQGDEGNEVWQNYTTRLMQVAERLEKASS